MRLQRLICTTLTAGMVFTSGLLQAQPAQRPSEQTPSQADGQAAGQAADEDRANFGRGQGQSQGPGQAQGPGRGQGQGPAGRTAPGGGRGLPPIPVLLALDADRNGELSATEINNAATALKALDRDRDGKLTREEMFAGSPQQAGEGIAADGAAAPAMNPEMMVQQLVMRTLQMDRDGDGQLSRDEIPIQLRTVVAQFDADQDESLDRAELILMAQRQVAAMMTRAGRGPAGPGQAGPGQAGPGQAGPAGQRGAAGQAGPGGAEGEGAAPRGRSDGKPRPQ